MLNQKEKKEILKDAEDSGRRDVFRQILMKDSVLSFDAYLKFLNGIHRVFSQTPSSQKRSTLRLFKL